MFNHLYLAPLLFVESLIGCFVLPKLTSVNPSYSSSLTGGILSGLAVTGILPEIQSFNGYLNIAESSSAALIAQAAKLQDTDFAQETARLAKNAILKNYSLAMVAQVQNADEDQLKLLA